ncbi:MAG: cell division protein ZapA [Bacillota bacterium]
MSLPTDSKVKDSKVKVEILGQEYLLKGDDPPEYVEVIARFVAQKMEYVSEKNYLYAPTKVAVLVALQLADELYKLREDYDKIVEELRVLDKIHKVG